MPALADPNFFQTVTYIGEHNAQGALGLVINRPLALTLSQLLEHLHITADQPPIAMLPVYHGGPVQPEQGFVLHRPLGQWGATLRVTDQIGITTSRDILQAVAWRSATPGGDRANWSGNWLKTPGWPSPLIRPSCFRYPVNNAGRRRRPSWALICDCCPAMPATPDRDAVSPLSTVAMPCRVALGFDFGRVRIGVAIGEVVTGSARPLAILPTRQQQPDWPAIARLSVMPTTAPAP